MFVQIGYGFPVAAAYGPQSASAVNNAQPAQPPGGGVHQTTNATNQTSAAPAIAPPITSISGSANAASNANSTAGVQPFSFPQGFNLSFSPAFTPAFSQGAAGFVTPFGLVAAPSFAGFGGFAANASAPAVGYPAAGDASASAGVANSGHQVSNPTNALASPTQGDSSVAGGNFDFGAPSAAGPLLLSPAFAGFGAPVFVALPVFAFYSQPPVAGPQPVTPPIAPPVAPPTTPPPPEPVAAAEDPVVDAPVAETPVPAVPPASPTIIDVPPAAKPAEPEPVVVLTPLTNAEFAKYEQEQVTSELSTVLKLNLTTAEGDVITLDFSQLDTLQSNRLAGFDADNKALDKSDDSEVLDRFVNIDIQGELSSAEQQAVDALLEDITAVAQQFFTGSMADATASLRNMNFDTSQLSELSLKMSMTRTTEISSGYREGMDQLDSLSSRGGEVMEMLDFMATEQRRLVDRAKEVFDDESAVRVVTSLIPPMLEQPAALAALDQLDDKVEGFAASAAAQEQQPIAAGA